MAFSQYFSGYISDRTQTRWGRRRPFVIIGAPLLAIAFFLLYSPHLFLAGTQDSELIFGYLLIFNSLYQAIYGILTTPYQSWMPEITAEHEYLEISGYQSTVNIIAFVIGAGSAFLLPSLLDGTSEEVDLEAVNSIFSFLRNGQIITLLIAIFAVSVIIFYIPAIFIIRAKEIFIPQPSIREELNVVFANRNYIWWTISRGFLTLALSIIMGVVLSWIDKALRFGTLEYLIFGFTLLGTILCGFIWWGKYGSKEGKTKSFLYVAIWMAIFMPLTLLIGQVGLFSEILGISQETDVLLQATIFVILTGIGVSGYYLLPYAIVADIAEEDEQRTGESRAGMYYGFESIPLNFFQFLWYLSVGFLLQNLPQFVDWRGNEFSLGFILWGPIAVVFIVISIFIFWRKVNADPLRTV
ncbi:MAG: MFS transporter [Candidatus Hodarchaeota archaeon]